MEKAPVEETDGLRDAGNDAGDIGPLGIPLGFLTVLLDVDLIGLGGLFVLIFAPVDCGRGLEPFWSMLFTLGTLELGAPIAPSSATAS